MPFICHTNNHIIFAPCDQDVRLPAQSGPIYSPAQGYSSFRRTPARNHSTVPTEQLHIRHQRRSARGRCIGTRATEEIGRTLREAWHAKNMRRRAGLPRAQPSPGIDVADRECFLQIVRPRRSTRGLRKLTGCAAGPAITSDKMTTKSPASKTFSQPSSHHPRAARSPQPPTTNGTLPIPSLSGIDLTSKRTCIHTYRHTSLDPKNARNCISSNCLRRGCLACQRT